MNRLLFVFVTFVLMAFAAAQAPTPATSKHQFIEAKLKDKELLRMATGKEFAIPQLRVYDKDGQQVADFSNYDEDTFKEDIDKVFRSPKPGSGKGTLKAELEIITDIKNKKLKDIAPADFTLVEYWSDWCEPCKELAALLQESLDAHKDLSINILHVEADPTKIPGVKVERQ
ncbi:MAG TPA: thioredoxin domain-containing protein [Candidatus Angelobacter sp.]|jgi:thiol-disulfide isomerase/thioredoxin